MKYVRWFLTFILLLPFIVFALNLLLSFVPTDLFWSSSWPSSSSLNAPHTYSRDFVDGTGARILWCEMSRDEYLDYVKANFPDAVPYSDLDPKKQEFCEFHSMGYNDEVWKGFVRTFNKKNSPDCYVRIDSQVRKDYSLFAYKDGKMFAFQFFGDRIAE